MTSAQDGEETSDRSVGTKARITTASARMQKFDSPRETLMFP